MFFEKAFFANILKVYNVNFWVFLLKKNGPQLCAFVQFLNLLYFIYCFENILFSLMNTVKKVGNSTILDF